MLCFKNYIRSIFDHTPKTIRGKCFLRIVYTVGSLTLHNPIIIHKQTYPYPTISTSKFISPCNTVVTFRQIANIDSVHFLRSIRRVMAF